jgi:hypothetical protein
LKSTLFSIVFCFLLASCADTYPLEGKYPNAHTTFYSDNSIDSVWNKIIHFLSERNMDVELNNYKGRIISKKVKLPATFEGEDGSLIFPDTYVVIEKKIIYNDNLAKRPSFTYYGDLYILVDSSKGKTSIDIKLYDIESSFENNHREYLTNSPNSAPSHDPFYTVPLARSTGVLEKLIFESVK